MVKFTEQLERFLDLKKREIRQEKSPLKYLFHIVVIVQYGKWLMYACETHTQTFYLKKFRYF